MKYFIRPAEDWVAIATVTLIACAVLSSCEPARAEGIPEIVLQTIALEAAGEPFEGQVMVAQTILNRAERGKRSPESVVLAPKQYSCWNRLERAKTWLDKHYTTSVRLRALKAYRMALVGYRLNRLTHYHRYDVMPYWAKGETPAYKVGAHWFYRGIK